MGAYLDDLFDQATREGGFQRAAGILGQWPNLGPQAKALLFPNPALRAPLDNFFLAAKPPETNPNPSGTALVNQATSLNPFRIVAGYAGSNLLYSPSGIRLSAGAVEHPSTDPEAVSLLRSQASRITGDPPPDSTGGPASEL